jgi:hypothetical protein
MERTINITRRFREISSDFSDDYENLDSNYT